MIEKYFFSCKVHCTVVKLFRQGVTKLFQETEMIETFSFSVFCFLVIFLFISIVPILLLIHAWMYPKCISKYITVILTGLCTRIPDFSRFFSGFRQCYKFSRIWLKQNWFMCYWKSFRFFQFFLFPQMIFNAWMFSFV